MRHQPEAGKQNRYAIAVLAAAALTAVLAAGCDSRVEFKGPRLSLPTAPIPPSTPTGAMATETRPIAGVKAVSLEAVGVVEITLGAAESLTITAPESVMPLLTSEVAGGRLVLDRTTPSYQGQASDIRYEVGLRRLDELILVGVGEIDAEGVDTASLLVQLQGVGTVRSSGRADRQEIYLGGLGDYLAPKLETRVTRVNMASGDAVIWATERIEGWVAAGCTLDYHGNPAVEVSGGGRVRKIGLGS